MERVEVFSIEKDKKQNEVEEKTDYAFYAAMELFSKVVNAKISGTANRFRW